MFSLVCIRFILIFDQTVIVVYLIVVNMFVAFVTLLETVSPLLTIIEHETVLFVLLTVGGKTRPYIDQGACEHLGFENVTNKIIRCYRL